MPRTSKPWSFLLGFSSRLLPSSLLSSRSDLSFLGLGLRPPAISWGVLLQDAQNIQALVISPWLLIPSFAVIIAVLAFRSEFPRAGPEAACDQLGCAASGCPEHPSLGHFSLASHPVFCRHHCCPRVQI